MYTFGYLREATQAHLDLDEDEVQAMDLQSRYHIFANEAMAAICRNKPKYEYFKVLIVDKYSTLINLGNGEFRVATEWEIEQIGTDTDIDFADEVDTKIWHNEQNIYEVNEEVSMPSDFISFAFRQKWIYKKETYPKVKYVRCRAKQNEDYVNLNGNKIKFTKSTMYEIPYLATWHMFKSGIGDDEVIDMPTDIFLTIPLYVASLCLQVDHAQKSAIKRNEFEIALSRCNVVDYMELPEVSTAFE